MIHRIKLFLYYSSRGILFKKYRNKWFDKQLKELIQMTLKNLQKGFMKTALAESHKRQKKFQKAFMGQYYDQTPN